MTNTSAAICNAFTVDVEDYFQVNAFARQIRPHEWDDYPLRVLDNTRRILELCGRHEVRGTFFILGWIADRCPQVVQEIQAAGHEIGCHSYWHQLIYRMGPEEFAADLSRATEAISQITGEPVRAFRAPCFSIVEQSYWALERLAAAGYDADSSIFPVHHDTYGVPNAERFPHVIETAAGALREFPPSVHRIGRWNLPVAGGGYFRLYPAALSLRWLRTINVRHHQPFMFYLHPWEVDPDQPRLPASWKSRFRHYQNLGSTARKLDQLLGRFAFGSLNDAWPAETPPEPTPQALSK